MKKISILYFCLFWIVGCRQTGIDDIEPIAPTFKTTCLLSKSEHLYENPNGSLQTDYIETYQYDSLKRIAEHNFYYKGGSDNIRYDYSIKDIYRYNSSGYLVEIITSGLLYNGYVKSYGNNLNPIAPISGKTTFTYQNGLLVKEEKYRKVEAEFLIEAINPRTDSKYYVYDTQGTLIKYRDENTDNNWVSYYLNNGKIIKSETDLYDSNGQKWVINDIFNQWGLLIQHNFPKIYYKNGSYQNITAEIGDYHKFTYDRFGRKIKFEEYRQEVSFNNGNSTISDNAVLMNVSEIQHEDTALPLTTIPLPKGHPKIPDFEGNKTYNIRSNNRTDLKSVSGNTSRKNSDETYNYDYNIEKLPTNLTIISNSYDDKGNISSKAKSGYKYEYVGCK